MPLERSTIDIESWDGTISSREFYISSCAFAEKWKKFNSALPQWSWCRCPKLLGVPSSGVEGYLCMDGIIPPRMSTMEDYLECDDGGLKETVCLEEDEFIDSAALVCMFCLFWCFRKKVSFEPLREMHDLSYSFSPKMQISPHLTNEASLFKVQPERHERCQYDFHVVYSLSYGVPVLYFRAYWSDGQPLALHDVEIDIPAITRQELSSCKWTFITQEDHPYLNLPWFTLHPCGTSEWMKMLFSRDTSAVALGGVAIDRYMVSWFSVVSKAFGLQIPLEMFGSG